MRSAASIAARPAVKLRFTGILPASITARFAITAALARRQHDARCAGRGTRAADSREARCAAASSEPRESVAVVHAVDHRGVELPLLQPAQAGLGEVAAQDRPLLVAILAELEKRSRTVAMSASSAGMRFAERDGDGIRKTGAAI